MACGPTSPAPGSIQPSDAGPPRSLADRIVRGDRVAVGRLITLLENGVPGVEDELLGIVSHTGRAHIVGVTGSPGSGKSTLVGKLAREFRRRGRRVGVIAVDPTSPFTGGAVLGDRVRMQDLALDKGIFIRSMASRGALGGVAGAATDAAKVLDAYGCDLVLVETVGAGQDEVDVARLAHTTVVVQVPGMGDEVQAIKAGILEIGDVFAVNKADRMRSDVAVSDLRTMLEMDTRPAAWTPPIVKTIATRGEGIAELADAVERHLTHLRASGGLAEHTQETARRELLEAARQRFMEELLASGGTAVNEMVKQVAERRIDARSAARSLLKEFRGFPLPIHESKAENRPRETPMAGDDGEGAE